MGEEGGLVVLPMKREVKVLNPVAIKIFSMLDGTHTEAQIADAVVEEFETSVEEAVEDIRAFLGDLRRNGMLVGGEETETPTEENS
jgi:hypothetical protein